MDSVKDSGIGSASPRKSSGMTIARVRATPRSSSDRPGIASTIAAALSNSVCIPASKARSRSAGTRMAKPQALDDAGR